LEHKEQWWGAPGNPVEERDDEIVSNLLVHHGKNLRELLVNGLMVP
jgi:hypothetical protein